MGPPPFGGGKPAGIAAGNRRNRCFNGASAFRRWKEDPVPLTARHAHVLQWGLRLSAVERPGFCWHIRDRICRFNGASAFRRWKAQLARQGWGVYDPLQWGLRLSAVESRTSCPTSPTSAALQWGLRLSAVESRATAPAGYPIRRFNGASAFRRWKGQPVRSPASLAGVASMGPPPFGGGKQHPSFIGRQGTRLASMGPPPFGGGKAAYIYDTDPSGSRLQWGLRLSAVERSTGPESGFPCWRCFNGASGFRRWKAAPLVHRAPGNPARFNGASAFRRWKGRLYLRHRSQRQPASMGPPPFGGGKPALRRADRRGLRASMGPPPFGGGKLSVMWDGLLRVSASMGPPPFGGGKPAPWPAACAPALASMGPPPFGGGKQVRQRPQQWLQGQASMGPPPFGGGKSRQASIAPSRVGLQWGLRLSAVERGRPAGTTGRTATGFNGASAFRRWKAASNNGGSAEQWQASMGPPPFGGGKAWAGPAKANSQPASMGPPPFGGGKWTCEVKAWARYSSFNGASAFRRWKVRGTIGAGAVTEWLQWGLRLSAVESRVNASARPRGTPLQWGLRLSAVERRRQSIIDTEDLMLQWGLRLSAVERRIFVCSMSDLFHELQWGLRLSAVESAICADFRSSVYDVVQSLPHQSPKSVSSSCLVAAHSQFRSCESARGLREGPHHWTSRKAPLFVPHTITAVLRGSSRAFPKTA